LAEAIRALPVFSSLPASTMDKLLAEISSEQIPAGIVLIHEGKSQEWMFILIEGLLQVFTKSGAHETTLAILPAPVLAFADAISCDAVALASARTLQPSWVARMPVAQARRLFEEERHFADSVTNAIAANWRSMLSECKNTRSRNGLQRLIAWVLAMQDRAGAASEIRLPYDKAVLASRLGMAPETLSRNLARLAALGVTIQGRRVTIDDARWLREWIDIDRLDMPPVP